MHTYRCKQVLVWREIPNAGRLSFQNTLIHRDCRELWFEAASSRGWNSLHFMLLHFKCIPIHPSAYWEQASRTMNDPEWFPAAAKPIWGAWITSEHLRNAGASTCLRLTQLINHLQPFVRPSTLTQAKPAQTPARSHTHTLRLHC